MIIILYIEFKTFSKWDKESFIRGCPECQCGIEFAALFVLKFHQYLGAGFDTVLATIPT